MGCWGVGGTDGVEEVRSAAEERKEDVRGGPRGGQALAFESGCSSEGVGGRFEEGPTLELCMSCALFQNYYYLSVKALYTVGYSTSLVTLTTAMVILCRFR